MLIQDKSISISVGVVPEPAFCPDADGAERPQ